MHVDEITRRECVVVLGVLHSRRIKVVAKHVQVQLFHAGLAVESHLEVGRSCSLALTLEPKTDGVSHDKATLFLLFKIFICALEHLLNNGYILLCN